MRLTIISIFFLLITPTAFSQSSGDEYYLGDQGELSADTAQNDQKATTVNISTGTSFISGSNGGSAVSTYIAPYVSHQLSPRWRLSLGTALVNSNFDQWTSYSLNDRVKNSGNVTYQQVFVQADYKASDKVTFSGAIYRHVLTLNPRPGEQAFSLPGNSYMLGVEYNLAPGLTVGVQVRQSQGGAFPSPFYQNQAGFGAFSNGFGSLGGW